MNILKILRQKARFLYFYIAVFGIINSIMASSVLYFVNTKLIGESLPFLNNYDYAVFAFVLISSLLVSYKFEMYMIGLTERIGVDMQRFIFEYLRYSEYERFLMLKEEKVRTALGDAGVLQGIPKTYISILNSSIMVIIGIIYLFYINIIAASVLLAIILITALYFVFQLKAIQKEKNKARNYLDDFIRILNDFILGFKELNMSIKKSEVIYNNYLIKILNDTMVSKLKYLAKFIMNRILGQYAIYIIIGIILFLLPSVTSLNVKSMTIFVTTFLFIAGPLTNLVDQMNGLTSIAISLNRLDKFEKTLKSNLVTQRQMRTVPELEEPFRRLKLENIEFEYLNKESASNFKLKKFNLEIQKGEVIFVTGGNGSGKSTFINILSGLFHPTIGKRYFNEYTITEEDYPQYRNLMACIFTDNYLFVENYDQINLNDNNKKLHALLEQMELTEVIDIDKEKNTVSKSLSKGQQKRLALIYALLEEKEIFIFDEWAAEQDPVFRKYFYHTIIPQLRESGKTVIAITHDDAYFDCADRMIKFEYGKIVKDEKIKKKELLKIKELQ